MDIKSENTCFGGVQGVYSHESSSCGVEMTFGLYLPEEAKFSRVPVLCIYLALLAITKMR